MALGSALGCSGWRGWLSLGDFGKLRARLCQPAKVCGAAGKTASAQTTKEDPKTSHRSQTSNGMRAERVTPAVTTAVAGGFLPRRGGEVVVAGKGVNHLSHKPQVKGVPLSSDRRRPFGPFTLHLKPWQEQEQEEACGVST